jgi:hypothetical protein
MKHNAIRFLSQSEVSMSRQSPNGTYWKKRATDAESKLVAKTERVKELALLANNRLQKLEAMEYRAKVAEHKLAELKEIK